MRLDGGGASSPQPTQGRGPLKPTRPGITLTDVLRKPVSSAPAAAPAPTSKAPTANDILGIAPFQPKPDPLSYMNREEITSDAAQRGRESGLLNPDQDKAEREKMLGISTGALTTTPDMLKEQLKQLTPEQYQHLSTRQRAAVDFNTMLATAVRKDLNRQDRYAKVGDQQKATYDESVKNMFGSDRGSDLYAPETMAVLRQLKIDDPTDDLDDYLGMKVAITEDDLKNVTEKQPVPNYVIDGRVPEESRGKLSVVEGLVDKTQQMESSLAKGKAMLQSFQATAAAERADDLGRLGGSSPLASRPGIGYQPTKLTETGAPADLNSYFRQAFDALANEKQSKDRPQILQALQADLHPDELEAFKSYADTRLRNTQLYGASMGDNPEAQYTSPKEFRKLLGLDK
jgi:hypothetical protein